MKLIQQLERKLSWRSSQRSTPGLAEAKARQRKENGKKQRQQQQLMAAKTAAAVRVSDAEFSPYISFGCRLKTVPLNADNSPTSYEVVAIRTRAPFQTIVAQQSSLYSSPHHHPRSPSPRSEGHRPESAGSSGDHHHHQQQQQQQQQPKTVEHIYDQIDCHHRRSSSLSPTTTTAYYQNHDHHHQWSPSSEGKQNHFGSQSPTASSGSNESSGSGSGSGSSHCGPITVTGGSSRRRRNRIKTNPWFAGSPWAAPATKSSKENHQQQQQQDKENIYESIENLLLNNRRKQQPPINQSYTRPFAQPSPPQNSSATYLRRPVRPTSLAVQKRKHLMETYPTSPMFLSSNQTVNPVEESPADHLLFTSPSVEFLNQSQQLCRQISSYFEDMSSRASPPPPREEMNSSSSTTTRPSLERKVDTLHQQSSLLLSNNTSDSMETIDLSPVNPFNHHHQPALSEWSLAAEDDDNDDDDNDNGHHRNDHHQWDNSTTVPTISSPAPPPPPPSTKSPSPPARNKRKLQSPTSRPESLYSNPPSNSPRRQSAKVDRLKCQLKEVVHAAIQQAKTKKNRKEV